MTLAIAIATGDGLVVAADSRTTNQFGDSNRRVLSDFTHKVFRIFNVVVATYGYAFLSGRNIAGHMAEFAQTFPEGEPSAEEVANALCNFFGTRFEQHLLDVPGDIPDPEVIALGFLVGGYDNGIGVVFEATIPSKTVSRIGDSKSGACAWRGQTDVVSRLIKGIDVGPLLGFADEVGLVQHVIDLQPACEKLEYVLLVNRMNLQDAVDLAVLLIRTTIDIQRLTHGTLGSLGSWPGVGGPIEIAAIDSRGFQWILETRLQGERPSGVAERI